MGMVGTTDIFFSSGMITKVHMNVFQHWHNLFWLHRQVFEAFLHEICGVFSKTCTVGLVQDALIMLNNLSKHTISGFL